MELMMLSASIAIPHYGLDIGPFRNDPPSLCLKLGGFLLSNYQKYVKIWLNQEGLSLIYYIKYKLLINLNTWVSVTVSRLVKY